MSAATAIVLTLLLVWAAATGIIIAVSSLWGRRGMSDHGVGLFDLGVNDRREELRWAAVRFLGHGLSGDQLQEAVCQATNCRPGEATLAIAEAINNAATSHDGEPPVEF